jgi:hypothetical protein
MIKSARKRDVSKTPKLLPVVKRPKPIDDDAGKEPLMARRLDGHRIRVDVLTSALQKGVRRRDVTLTMWAVCLLCRGNLWKFAIERLVLAHIEESNAFTEPFLREHILRILKRLWPQLSRKGVDLSTGNTPKLILELILEICLATKSRLTVNALTATYAAIADEMKDLREILPRDEENFLLNCFKLFKRAYEDQNEADTLKWLCLLEMHGKNNAIYGVDKVWRYLKISGKKPEKIQALHLFVEDKYLTTEWTQRLALFEAALLAFYPLRAVGGSDKLELPPSRRVSDDKKQMWKEQWTQMWQQPLEPALRLVIDWKMWLPIVLDVSTAAGKNRDTLHELMTRFRTFPLEEFAAPDCSGTSHPSYVQHEFTVCQQIANKTVADPYETKARHFLSNIERGNAIPVLGKGVDCIHLDRVRHNLGRLLQPSRTEEVLVTDDLAVRPGSQNVQGILSSTGTFSSFKRLSIVTTSTDGGASSKTSTPSVEELHSGHKTADETGRQRSNSADPVRSHAMSKAPCPMPGLLVAKQEIVSGPVVLDDCHVTYCQLGEVPHFSHSPKWFIGLDDRTSWIVQQCAEMASTIPIHLDRIKPKFGLSSLGLRWSDTWLIMRDMGSGGPYQTQVTGPKRYDVVPLPETGLIPLDQYKGVCLDTLMEQLTRALLFRSIFQVTPTALHHFWWQPDTFKLYSVHEPTVSQTPLSVRDTLDATLFRPHVPQQPAGLLENLHTFWTRPEIQQKITGWFNQWSAGVYDLPLPARPMSDFPQATHLLQNINALRPLFLFSPKVDPPPTQ